MITAKNYAAQAEVALINASKRNIVGGRKDRADYIGALARGIRQGVKFVIPDEGRILDDSLRGIMSTPVRLPFEVTVIEFAIPHYPSTDQYSMHKVVILCIEFGEDGDFKIHPMMYLMGAEQAFWIPCAYEAVVPFEDQLQLREDGQVSFRATIVPSGAVDVNTDENKIYDPHTEVITKCIRSTYELLEALTCTNIEQSIYQQASPKNAQRIKSHKAPIYETRCLTLKTTKKESFSGTGGLSHKSPKQHLRRGHIRRLEKGNIWVNSCVVGDASNGKIDKQYKVER